ncbi:(2Fe-2S)-binding protein [Parendozoicomonas haliclonae]|uniref:4-hydroxybenzoyl-CoA reductase subunit gamma n=1 Tax=Parendozoicomonas haliclonae TaxID=1960125 RepID=A0A1X7AKZ0_9GAMM|nr:2Fe-2S iron-sulfur cluster-binding protein [Parendozoicomonas haliclonae]SMA48350.1 4-hydroxybenzoyl-CoA reductase subunit gamma [Parendozoicomonas haliclonae]
MAEIEFSVNGQPVHVPEDKQEMSLLEYLQEEMRLTGTKFCCGIGVCQACTVAVKQKGKDELKPTVTCVTPLKAVDGWRIQTVEGVALPDGTLHPIQAAFLDEFAFQCGYCTPGFLMASIALWEKLKKKPVPKDKVKDVVMDAIGTHICRCTGYVRYHHALRKVILAEPGLTV